MNEETEMDYLFKLSTPVYGTQTVPVETVMDELKRRLRYAKEDNEYFDRGYKRYEIAMDETGTLWMVGFTK